MHNRDGGGSISEKEYIQAVKRYQYQRVNRCILYHLINADGIGEICIANLSGSGRMQGSMSCLSGMIEELLILCVSKKAPFVLLVMQKRSLSCGINRNT